MVFEYDPYDDLRLDLEIERYQDDLMKKISKGIYKMFLLVEGSCEEIYFNKVFVELKKSQNMIIANYNGINNLENTIRIICNTLSNNAPIIITYDNDIAGDKEILKIKHSIQNKKIYKNDYLYYFKIPFEEKVNYSDKYKGGSFEEMFDFEIFFNACFSKGLLPEAIIKKKEVVFKEICINRPWIDQIQKILAINGFTDFVSKKTKIAEILSLNDNLPFTVSELKKFILTVRRENLIHPELEYVDF